MSVVEEFFTQLSNGGVCMSNEAKIKGLIESSERPIRTLILVASQGRPQKMGFYAHPFGIDHTRISKALSLLDKGVTEEDFMMFTANIYEVLPFEPVIDVSGVFA